MNEHKHNDATHPTIKKLVEEHGAVCHCSKPPNTKDPMYIVPSHMEKYRKECSHLKEYDTHRGPLTYTYIFHLGEDYYKIGKTWNVGKRMKTFQMSNPFITGTDSVIALIEADVEKRLHKWCVDKGWHIDGRNRIGQLASELFKIPIDEMIELFDYIGKYSTRYKPETRLLKLEEAKKQDRGGPGRRGFKEAERLRRACTLPIMSRGEVEWLLSDGDEVMSAAHIPHDRKAA